MSDNKRFAFGKNWKNFSKTLTKEKVLDAQNSLTEWLGEDSIGGKRFLDIGSGSGLFSLAAYRLGASEVYSFDYDADSAGCTASLRARFAKRREQGIAPEAERGGSAGQEERMGAGYADRAGDGQTGCTDGARECQTGRAQENRSGTWVVERGDVLDEDYISRFYGKYDIVYSWGVLHHTGNMYKALENAAKCVSDKAGSKLFIAIYNDQGVKSDRWRMLKRFYCSLPEWGKRIMIGIAAFWEFGIKDTLVFVKHPIYMINLKKQKPVRGMNRFYDLVDWYGGYPFEVAKPEEILDFYQARGFRIVKMKTCGGGLGCNEYVFEKARESAYA